MNRHASDSTLHISDTARPVSQPAHTPTRVPPVPATKKRHGISSGVAWKFPRLQMDPIACAVYVGLLLTNGISFGAALFFATCLHEAGHLLLARCLHIPVRELRVGLLGARIETQGALLSYRAEAELAAAGPIASFAGAALTAPLWHCSSFFAQFCAVSLFLGLLNLLPVESFDGGRMLSCLLCATIGARYAAVLCRGISFCMLFLTWCMSVYLLLRAGSGISWLGFSASLLGRFFAPGAPSGMPHFARNPEENSEKR